MEIRNEFYTSLPFYLKMAKLWQKVFRFAKSTSINIQLNSEVIMHFLLLQCGVLNSTINVLKK